LDDAVAEIGRNVTGVQGDVSNLDDLDRLVEAVIAHTGRVDVLFASAGNHTFDEPLGAVTERSFDEVFDVNVRGTFFTVRRRTPATSPAPNFRSSAASPRSEPPTALSRH
jgi:NAD(P)-dependent dehydrogenase (short-subunit alcohol dehydrogenase family)